MKYLNRLDVDGTLDVYTTAPIVAVSGDDAGCAIEFSLTPDEAETFAHRLIAGAAAARRKTS